MGTATTAARSSTSANRIVEDRMRVTRNGENSTLAMLTRWSNGTIIVDLIFGTPERERRLQLNMMLRNGVQTARVRDYEFGFFTPRDRFQKPLADLQGFGELIKEMKSALQRMWHGDRSESAQLALEAIAEIEKNQPQPLVEEARR